MTIQELRELLDEIVCDRETAVEVVTADEEWVFEMLSVQRVGAKVVITVDNV